MSFQKQKSEDILSPLVARPVIWVLVVLLFCIVASSLSSRGPISSEISRLCFIGAVTSLSIFCGTWLGLGQVGFRWILVAVTSILLWSLVTFSFSYGVQFENQLYLWLDAILVFLPMLAIFAATFSIRKSCKVELVKLRPSQQLPSPGSIQYNLIHLIVVTTLIAIALSLIVQNFLFFTSTLIGTTVSVCLIIAAHSIIVIWAALGYRLRARQAISFLVMIGSCLACFLLSPDVPSGFNCVSIVAAIWCVTTIFFLLLRQERYRIVRTPFELADSGGEPCLT